MNKIKVVLIILVLTQIIHNATAQSWSLTGNSGTDPSTQFLGTTDNKALKIRTNNLVRLTVNSSGKVGIGTTSPVFKLDVKSGSINTDSVYRIGGVTAISFKSWNTYVGSNSGFSNTYGNYNSALGFETLYSNTSGSNNVACGDKALHSNTSGGHNVALGAKALYNNTTSYYNIAIGSSALEDNTGSQNTAVGHVALANNTSGYSNTATGYQTLSSNSTGVYNTAIGSYVLGSNTSGYYNTGTGAGALSYLTTGSENTVDGYYGLFYTTAAWGNTALGCRAGNSYNNSSFNTFLGSDADANGAGYYLSTAIGCISTITASYQIRVGSSTISSIGGYQNWTNLSDGRYKNNVKEDVKGLDFILKLRPVTYNLDVTGISRHLNEERGHEFNQQEKDAIAAKEKVVFSGFIAQDVEKSAKEVGYDFSGVDAPKNENDLYGLRYAEFVVPLVKAVQELDQENGELKIENGELKDQIAKLNEAVFGSKMNSGSIEIQSEISNPRLPARSGTGGNDAVGQAISEIILGQNIPNPFGNSTLIPFRIPKDCRDASILIMNTSTSEVLSVIPISCNEDHVSVDAGKLLSGMYTYTLYVDGKMIDSKQMELIK